MLGKCARYEYGCRPGVSRTGRRDGGSAVLDRNRKRARWQPASRMPHPWDADVRVTDNEKTVTAEQVAGGPVRNPVMVAFVVGDRHDRLSHRRGSS